MMENLTMKSSTAVKLQVKYKVGIGIKFTDLDAKILGTYLTGLAKKHGKLTRELLLEIAEADTSCPLRKYLEWDDRSAARRYRLVQIGQLLRTIKYRVMVGKHVIESRVFESVVLKAELPNVAPGRGYVRASVVHTHVDLSQQILDRALREIKQWQDRYKIHDEFAKQFAYIFQAIDSWEEEVTALPKSSRMQRSAGRRG